jgi:hypothetical protein
MSHDWRNPERVAPWKPRQRFLVTPTGRAAVERYRSTVEAAQQGADPRRGLERAKSDWASELGLRPGDGILLEDLAAGHVSLAEMRETLAACNLSLREARGTLDRLVSARLIEPVDGSSAAASQWPARS